jgi:hypothetical protein
MKVGGGSRNKRFIANLDAERARFEMATGVEIDE